MLPLDEKKLNEIAKLEKAIKERWGEEAIKTPQSGWDEEKEKILFQLYVLKFEQHPHELYNLLRTGMRPIILRAKGNYTWPNGSGTNVAGETLQKIRKFYYTKKLNWPIINGLPSTVKDSVLREPSSTVVAVSIISPCTAFLIW